MSLGEVDKLRKQGLLDEALKVAEMDFEAASYTLAPVAVLNVLSDISKINGREIEAFTRLKSVVGCLTEDSHMSAGWIIYRYLKTGVSFCSSYDLRKALFIYLKLKVDKPSLLHSLIMKQAVELERQHHDSFKFLEFFRIWGGVEMFSEEDWKRFRPMRGRSIPSLVEQVATRCGAEVKDDKMKYAPEHYVNLLDKAVEYYKDNANLKRYKAYLYYLEGDMDSAIEIYKKILLHKKDSYLWEELSELTDDVDYRKMALARAMLSGQKEEFLVNIHLSLANCFIWERDFSHALAELEAYRKTYELHGWKLKNDYSKLRIMIPEGTIPEGGNKKFYRILSSGIDDIIYSVLPEYYLMLDNLFVDRRHKKMAFLISDDGKRRYIVEQRLLKKNDDNAFVTFYAGRVSGSGKKAKVVSLRAVEKDLNIASIFKLSKVMGRVRLKKNNKGQQYAFVEDCYIYPRLAAGLVDDERVICLSKKGEKGDVAVKVCKR